MENKNQFFLKDLGIHKGLYTTGVKTKLLDLSDNLDDIVKTLKDSPLSEHSKKLNEEISEILSQGNDGYNERLAKLESTLDKYWEVKQIDGNDNVLKVRLIFAYRIININSTYWFVEGIVDDDYNSGMRDKSSDIYYSFNNCQFTEITKEEFVKRVNEHTNVVLDKRLHKMLAETDIRVNVTK